MSLPFSLDPADYDMVKSIFATNNVTPIILVLGGSYGQNTAHIDSDLDLFGVYEEEKPEEISIHPDEQTTLFGDYQGISITLHSMNNVKESIADPYQHNDPPRRMWFYEEFMTFPRIWDTPAAQAYRDFLATIPQLDIAGWYLESGDWYIEMLPDNEKFRTRVIRIFLTGARLLELDELIIDYQVLMEWAENPSVTEARKRLQDAIDKL